MDGCEKPQRVAVCIASYRRPQGLHALLGALEAQRFAGARPDIVLVVCDNDAAESARDVCEDARGWLSLPLRYVLEPRKGIPFARNASVREAGDADWLAFIDDDEVPDPHWLDTLLRVQRETGADVVTGPVHARLDGEPPAWVLEGEFFARESHPTGTLVATACTNNALLRARSLAGERELFDTRFRFGVGEDTLLFSRLAERGARIVWAEEAAVHERVPAERVRVRWLVRRGFASGTAMTHIARCRRGAARAGVEALVHAGWCVARGLALALWPAPGARARRVRGLQSIGCAAGRIAGIAGVS
jgi:glycosyltransferase involved in cell wall biosynthesis